MYLACLLALLVGVSQEPRPEPTVPQRLDALIAKVNRYTGFVVRYELHDDDGHDYSLRIAYRAPHDLVLDLQKGGSRSFSRLRGSSLDIVNVIDQGPVTRACLRESNPYARFARGLRDVIEHECPGILQAKDLGVPEFPTLHLQVSSEPTSLMFSIGFGVVDTPRFVWLEDTRRRPEQVSLGGEGSQQLIWSISDKLSVEISSVSGLVSRIWKRSEGREHAVVELTSLDLAARPDASEFELPEIPDGARDNSTEVEESIESGAFHSAREDLFRTFGRCIDDGRIKWTDETPARLEHVVRALHDMHSAVHFAGVIAVAQGLIDKSVVAFSDWLAQVDVTDPDTQTKAVAWVRKSRESLESQLKSSASDVVEEPPVKMTCKLRPSLCEDLTAMEQRMQPGIFTEGVTKPLLAAFDEKVAKLLVAK